MNDFVLETLAKIGLIVVFIPIFLYCSYKGTMRDLEKKKKKRGY